MHNTYFFATRHAISHCIPLRLTFGKYKEIFLENKIIFMENSWILLQFLSENWIATLPNDIIIYVKLLDLVWRLKGCYIYEYLCDTLSKISFLGIWK